MDAMRRLLVAIGVFALVALAAACGDSAQTPQATTTPEVTATPRPIPSPVEFAQEPQGAELGDPSFEALSGATAHFGRLGGSIYRIEIPDDWNGRLVVYLHGFRGFGPTLTVDSPGIRGYLIQNGFAWAASSFSSNSFIPGLTADETAALWDLFAEQFGRPELTYVTGHSMGGGGTAIAAERYSDRFDGALGLCGVAGSGPELEFLVDSYTAAAFVAGITQAEFESTPATDLVTNRLVPLLADEAARERFENIVIDLTGGPRPFAREGVRRRAGPNLELVGSAVGAGLDVLGLFDNQDRVYALGPLSDVSSEEFNAAAIRASGSEFLETFTAGQNITGEIKIPLLTVHTTGDFFVPISQQQVLRRMAEAAGAGDLLVQRSVRAPEHCGFTSEEWEASLEALIAWVEDGIVPAGEDLLADDLSDIGGDFTLTPRQGDAD